MAFSALTSLKLELYLYGVGPHAFRDLLVFIRSIPTLEDVRWPSRSLKTVLTPVTSIQPLSYEIYES